MGSAEAWTADDCARTSCATRAGQRATPREAQITARVDSTPASVMATAPSSTAWARSMTRGSFDAMTDAAPCSGSRCYSDAPACRGVEERGLSAAMAKVSMLRASVTRHVRRAQLSTQSGMRRAGRVTADAILPSIQSRQMRELAPKYSWHLVRWGVSLERWEQVETTDGVGRLSPVSTSS